MMKFKLQNVKEFFTNPMTYYLGMVISVVICYFGTSITLMTVLPRVIARQNVLVAGANVLQNDAVGMYVNASNTTTGSVTNYAPANTTTTATAITNTTTANNTIAQNQSSSPELIFVPDSMRI
jgi:hypothetical protein